MEQTLSLRKTARLTGLLYFILAIMGVFCLMYLPSQTVVQGDSVATCQKILSNEFIYRIGIAVSVTSNILYVFLALLFYRLFKNVNERLAALLVIFVLVQTPISFIFDTLDITSLLILKGEVMKFLSVQQAQEYSILLRKIISHGITMMELFWGLWLIPMGILIYRSGFIPRIIGVLVLITAFAYPAVTITFILFPDYVHSVEMFAFPAFFGELAIIFWLLIKGVKKGYN